jgi:hypothetical protein
LTVSVKSTVDCAVAGAVAFAWPLDGNFPAATEIACVLDFPFASPALAAFRRALLVMTKRRRTGAVFALVCRPPLRDALAAAVFLFNINNKTRTIRFSSEKTMGNLCFADCGDPELFTRPLAHESGDCEHRKTDAA